MKRLIAILSFIMLLTTAGMAQMKGGTPVQVSHKVEVINGKRFMVHIVEQGQTVYAIARAYGLKEVEAVTKKDVHFLQIGDTVWLPCRGQKMSDGTVAPPASISQPDNTSHPSQQPQHPTAPKSSNNPASSRQPAATTAPEPPAPIGPAAVIRPRVNPSSVVVSLMMPLRLSQMDKISTSKFDVEQRGKITYKSLEFIQFYEGLLLGLERLEQMGYHVVLNVVDVEGETDEEVEKAFVSHNVAQSDLLIAMLTRKPFQKAAQLARDAQLFIVNPVSDRSEIVDNNPYVFKCMPSIQARAKATVEAIRRTLPNSPVYIVHSNAKSEKAGIKALTEELDRYPDMHYTMVDWASSAKLTSMLKNAGQAAVVSMYEQDKSKKRIYVSQLLNKLSSIKIHTPVLFTFDDWSMDYSDVDFSQLQSVNYHTFYSEWDMGNQRHKDFVELFRQHYKTEPTQTYAGMANDIILYFVCGLQQKGTAFFSNPVLTPPQGMLYPLSFTHSRADYGYENQYSQLFRMSDYHFNPVE